MARSRTSTTRQRFNLDIVVTEFANRTAPWAEDEGAAGLEPAGAGGVVRDASLPERMAASRREHDRRDELERTIAVRRAAGAGVDNA